MGTYRDCPGRWLSDVRVRGVGCSGGTEKLLQEAGAYPDTQMRLLSNVRVRGVHCDVSEDQKQDLKSV